LAASSLFRDFAADLPVSVLFGFPRGAHDRYAAGNQTREQGLEGRAVSILGASRPAFVPLYTRVLRTFGHETLRLGDAGRDGARRHSDTAYGTEAGQGPYFGSLSAVSGVRP
jgi:hypothetical protein